ncbi:MAG: UPF0182 family protein [Symploca sp. SIO2C1]|nr:UPF0182 family protein [Symploca sp. SIO2C1]
MSRRFWNQFFRSITVLLGLLLAWDLLANLVAEILWFEEVDYLSSFLLRFQTQVGLWFLVCFISAGFLLGNLFLANRLKHKKEDALATGANINQKGKTLGDYQSRQTYSYKTSNKVQPVGQATLNLSVGVQNPPLYRRSQGIGIASATGKETKTHHRFPPLTLGLRSLLLVILLLCTLVSLMLLHYSIITFSLWEPDLNAPHITPPLPASFNWMSLKELLLPQPSGIEEIWQLGFVAVVIVALMIKPLFCLGAIAIVLSLFWSVLLSCQWSRVLEYFHPTAFQVAEPQFGHDISFHIFSLPVWQLLDFWLGGLFLFGLVAVVIIYLASGNSLSQGKFSGFSQNQLRHLSGLSTPLAVIAACRYWFSRYQLLYSHRGVSYGAGYTDVNIQLDVNTGLSILALAIAIFFLSRTIFSFRRFKTTAWLVIGLWGLYLVVEVIVGVALPALVQRFIVQPSELAREKPYIERSIALTRTAFDLDDIEAKAFDPEGKLTRTELKENDLTIRNIRLWDTRPILETNRQLQQIRLYYKFPDADIDRYTLKVEQEEKGTQGRGEEEAEGDKVDIPNSQFPIPNSQFPIPNSQFPKTTEKQQVIIAARELDYNTVPQEAKTWVNKHLIYTHGYGFTLSPVNTVDKGGLPDYFVKDIGTGADPVQAGTLWTSSKQIRDSIPTSTPRIYFGELTNTYVMTSTKTGELDYPSDDDNVYNTYDGNGGIALDSIWRRLLFAQYLKDWQMLLTRNFTPQTKLLFRRNINQRIRAIAPFLRYDYDPYIVSADIGNDNRLGTDNYLYWIVDAYTTSNHYPYSDPGQHEFNYIRNSVKVVIDAYHGDINFYVADPQDPIIQTWIKIFPNLFKPLEAMPEALRSHIRYPEDLFQVQSERLLIYHMTDPQVFYNREDLWQSPQEIYGAEAQPLAPYYLIMKLPTETSEEFILLHPYTPARRNNLIAWLAGRSDGAQYGKLLLYQFPKQELIYGPEQIEALINQDPTISGQISLWNRQGSSATQGNLLVIPIEQSLLYVEPLYLEAERNSLPTLVKVIVVYNNRIVMADNLEQGLNAIFEPEEQSTPTIIRQLGEEILPLEVE